MATDPFSQRNAVGQHDVPARSNLFHIRTAHQDFWDKIPTAFLRVFGQKPYFIEELYQEDEDIRAVMDEVFAAAPVHQSIRPTAQLLQTQLNFLLFELGFGAVFTVVLDEQGHANLGEILQLSWMPDYRYGRMTEWAPGYGTTGQLQAQQHEATAARQRR